MKLTALDITALRQADGYSLHLDHNGGTGTARLSLSKRLRKHKPGPFESKENEYYTIEGSSGQLVTAYFGDLYSPGSWRALAQIVRPGDVLNFYAFTNNNQYMDSAEIPAGKLQDHSHGYPNLYTDELRVTVYRFSTGRDGRTKQRAIVDSMLLSYSICPDNTARAIRCTKYRLTVSA